MLRKDIVGAKKPEEKYGKKDYYQRLLKIINQKLLALIKSYGFCNYSCKSHRTYVIIFAKVVGLLQINH